MPVRFSEQREYIIAIPAFVEKDYATARTNLEALIERLRLAGETGQTAYLLHVLGNVEAEAGELEKGHSLHRKALDLAGPHPFEHLMYATGLVRSFSQPKDAIAQVEAAEELIRSGQWTPSEEDMPREWYESEFAKIRAEADGHEL